MKQRLVIILCLGLTTVLLSACSPESSQLRVNLVTAEDIAGSARYGLEQLEHSLQSQGHTVHRTSSMDGAAGDLWIIAGDTSERSRVRAMLTERQVRLPEGPEALAVRKTSVNGIHALLLCGSDERGLMYAALDAAERMSWHGAKADPLLHVRDVSESPYILERSVSTYTMQRAWFEARMYNPDYWAKYFDMLVRNRINSFAVIFGYENGGFMAPLYPYYFDLASFPDVKLVGITPEEQRRNVEAFRRMIDLAHERGIDVIAGIWDHIYRGGVQGGGIRGAGRVADQPTPGLVWGVTAENLSAYNKAAVSRFLDVFPALDGLQFRMHAESGLKPEEMEEFWHEIFLSIKDKHPEMRVDIRAKELPNSIINDGLQLGIHLRVATKYWMEQMGLPFHPTHVNRQNQHDRRHGLADLLSYPQRYRVHWRLWNGGTARVLLWGDPDYARRFAESARVYDGNSFEVNEPLATKMLAQPHDAVPFQLINAPYRHYEYEFERYWHFYQTFGREGYHPQSSGDVYEQTFTQHFGSEAGRPLMEGLHLASRVLTRIVAADYLYRYFPATRGWAEKQRMGDLPVYATAEGSDIQQFLNFEEEAALQLSGDETAQRRPAETSRWFAETFRSILNRVEEAERCAGDSRTPEYSTTVADLKILAYLSLYHARRIPAAVAYNLYRKTRDWNALDDAIRHEQNAIDAWEQIVAASGDIYTDNLAMGIPHGGLAGHWKDELADLRKGLTLLKLAQDSLMQQPVGDAPVFAHVPVRKMAPGTAAIFRATVRMPGGIQAVRCTVTDESGNRTDLAMSSSDGVRYSGEYQPPAGTGGFTYYLEALDAGGHAYHWPSTNPAANVAVLVTGDTTPPVVAWEPVTKAIPLKPFQVSVRAQDASGIKWLRLRYRHLTQFEDYQTLAMQYNPRTETYETVIPGSFIVPEWDVQYFIEALDTRGNGCMVPDMEHDTPYVIVHLVR